nr:pyridoxine 5'-phosphate oxidase C-terminal domain-containing protein [Flavobacterium nitratireducens]
MLHDRIIYSLQEDYTWKRERLASTCKILLIYKSKRCISSIFL